MRRRPLVLILVIGIGFVAAPGIFQMFTRAPKGGQMIKEFRPFMTQKRLGAFQGYLDEIDRSHEEVRNAKVSTFPVGEPLPATRAWLQRWPAIDKDMSGMLSDIVDNIDNFAAVNALPPFVLFPWFFVLPGAIIAFGAWRALRSPARGKAWFLGVMGVGLIAAPAIFQMFTRAPLGADMIKDFRPLMTDNRVTQIQQHFLVIAGAEGELRTKVLPAAGVAGTALPSTARFSRDWPHISHEMAPMIGAMSDNLDNYAAVKALPPFWLFPWFFVLPGLIVIAAAFAALRQVSVPVAATTKSEEVRA